MRNDETDLAPPETQATQDEREKRLLDRLPPKWLLATVVMMSLALIAIGAAALAVSANTKASEGQAKIIALEVAAQQTKDLRASEKLAAKARKESECRSAIKGTAQATAIIEGLRATYLELARESINPAAADTLRARAQLLPMFQPPKCDPGRPAKKKKAQAP